MRARRRRRRSARRPSRHDAARVLDQRDQRLDVVGLQAGLDHDVDESHRELRVAVAVAAVAHEPRAVGRGGVRARAGAAIWKWRGSVVATTASSIARGSAACAAAGARRRGAIRAAAIRRDERFADIRLMRDADDRPRAVVQRDRASPSAAGRG